MFVCIKLIIIPSIEALHFIVQSSLKSDIENSDSKGKRVREFQNQNLIRFNQFNF